MPKSNIDYSNVNNKTLKLTKQKNNDDEYYEYEQYEEKSDAGDGGGGDNCDDDRCLSGVSGFNGDGLRLHARFMINRVRT